MKDARAMKTRKLIAEGHLIDTGLMSKFLDAVVENGGKYELLRFDIGRTVSDFSRVEMSVSAEDDAALDHILENLVALGAHPVEEHKNVTLRRSDKAGTVPDDFYSTTNHRTRIHHAGSWIDVQDQRMDAVIVVNGSSARCVKLRDIE